MIFLFFVILTVLGIVVCVATGKISDKHDYHEENNTRFVNFVYHNDEPIYWTFGTMAVISGIVILVMLICIIAS